MNREIKFRGRTYFHKWVYGDLRRFSTCCGIATSEEIFSYIAVDPDTIGQYTGLKDKNGKEIFEGDIVRTHRETIDVVTYDSIAFNMCVAYAAYPKGKCATFFNSNPLEGIEVVGNIFDNPEILKEGK